jgi:hypothetical protein
MYNDYIKLFIASSSIFFTMFPILYLSNAYKQLTDYEKEQLTISFSSAVIFLPILFGIVFSVAYATLKGRLPKSVKNMEFFIIGSAGGLIVSLVLIYVLKIPEQWFKETNSAPWVFYISLFYGALLYILGPLLFNGRKSRPTVFTPSTSSNKPPPVTKPVVSNVNANMFDKLQSLANKEKF